MKLRPRLGIVEVGIWITIALLVLALPLRIVFRNQIHAAEAGFWASIGVPHDLGVIIIAVIFLVLIFARDRNRKAKAERAQKHREKI